MAAQKEGIVTELVASRGKIPVTMITGRLSKRLYENVGIAEEFAAWSVETWSAALEATLPKEPTKLIIHCPLCGARGRSSANNAGKVVECPKCKGSFGISADGERTTAEVGAPKGHHESRFKFNKPDPSRALLLRARAVQAAKTDRLDVAISLIEEATRLDTSRSLTLYERIRALFYSRLGDERPQKAIDAYNKALNYKRSGDSVGAIGPYFEAIELDACFSWPYNNLAWMLATHSYTGLHNGKQAIVYGIKACELSNWSSWPHLGSLSAAFARAGDFTSAIEVAKAALQLTPDRHKGYSQQKLLGFMRGEAYTDNGDPVADGLEA